MRRLEQATRQVIERMEVPSNREINQRRMVQFQAQIIAALEHPELEAMSGLIQEIQTKEGHPIEKIAGKPLAILAKGDGPMLLTEEAAPAVSPIARTLLVIALELEIAYRNRIA